MPGENSKPAEPAAPVAAAPVAPAASAAPAAAAVPAAAAPAAGESPAAAAPILGAAEKPAEPAKPEAVPEKYEFKIPQGYELDAVQLDAYLPVFKELELTQSQAQKLIDKSFEILPKLAEASQAQVQAEIAKQNAEWAKASREDKEFGGANYDANTKLANAAFAQFASKELRQLMLESGYVSHPEFVRLFWNIGQKLSESIPPAGGSTPSQNKTTAASLYPSMQQH